MARQQLRVGLLSFSDGRERVHATLAPDIRQHETKIRALLEASGDVLVTTGNIVQSTKSARDEAHTLERLDLDGIIFNIAVFAFPNFITLAAQMIGRTPLLLLGPHDSRYPGLTGLLAAAGALQQIGVQHERLWLDLEERTAAAKLVAFARAAAAAKRIRGQVYGLIGGRSIGMGTGAAAPDLWQRYFGVDIDHVDQSEIIRQAPLVPATDVSAAKAWLQQHLKEIVFDQGQFTPEKWDYQVRCWIALTNIVERAHFAFVGLKCHHEMSEFHCVQCLSAAFLNDPYDWRGPKNPVPLACESDSDGALTMQLLQMVSNKPACLLDLRFFDRDKQVFVMPNCGAAPTWFAARSDDPTENLRHVRLLPAISKYAGGGAHVEFIFGEGPLTLARLTRSPSGYQLLVTSGEAVKYAASEVVGAGPNWPHAFVRLGQSPDTVVRALQANHLHAVAGDYREELSALSRFLDLRLVSLTDFSASASGGSIPLRLS